MLVVLALALPACAAKPPMYAWGRYQDSLYAMWIRADAFDVRDHLAILTEDIERAESEERLVPPGVRAHVAMLFFEAGNTEEARRYLLDEKAAFPEATVFVDGMLARMDK
jgi:hypothetical protein